MRERLMVVAEDSVGWALTRSLARLGYEVFGVVSPDVALNIATRRELDLVLVALELPGGSGLALCRRIVGMRCDLPVVIVCPEDTVQAAVNAVRAGAFDVLGTPADAKVLDAMVARALAHGQLQRTVKGLRDAGVAKWLGV